MHNRFRYGNKAALIVGIFLMLIDEYPLAHEFGAWNIGCLLCVWYSATAIQEDSRIGKKIKYMLFTYLAIVFVLAVSLHESGEQPAGKRDWSLHPALRTMGIGAK